MIPPLEPRTDHCESRMNALKHTHTGRDAPSESKRSPSFQMCGLQWRLCSLTVLHRSMEKFKMLFSLAFSLLSSSTALKAFYMVSKKKHPRLMLRQLVIVVWSISKKTTHNARSGIFRESNLQTYTFALLTAEVGYD